MHNPARTIYRYAMQDIEQRPLAEQIEILEAIADCTNDVNETEALIKHAEDLRNTLSAVTQLKLSFI